MDLGRSALLGLSRRLMRLPMEWLIADATSVAWGWPGARPTSAAPPHLYSVLTVGSTAS
ncbi:hypothetical protein FRAHR75_400059 [Frankia sp. Hr75.2]|nr:hypothetical protein FRAHR75_400059 [Frankia sp. Hr75.2]